MYEPLSSKLGQAEVANLLGIDDKLLVGVCNEQRLSLASSPAQSGFRVFALLFFTTETIPGVQLIEGTNSEPSFIGGSICAERAALCKLRMFSNPRILKIVVTTDAKHVAISPGLLCREYLMAFCAPDTPVVMGDALGEDAAIMSCSISELYPHPFLYRGKSRLELVSAGRAQAERIAATAAAKGGRTDWGEEGARLHAHALTFCERDAVDIHPLKFAAAVIFDDDSVQVAWMLKGLEYGCSLDPVSQLVRDMLKKRPRLLVMVDQFGVAHAPFAQARALLSEHGLGTHPRILVHSHEGKQLLSCAADLAPPPPGSSGSARLLVPSDLGCGGAA